MSDRPVSLDALRARLVSGIPGTGIDALPQNATSHAAAEADAKAKQCDFILYTDVSSLNISAAKKLGGILGRHGSKRSQQGNRGNGSGL